MRTTSPAFRLHLESQSILTLWHPDTTEDSVEADLARGCIVFSAARNGSINVVANDASIRPAGNAATVAHVRVVNPKELRIYAPRGALEFSYHGESELIAEDEVYRVLLDPSEKEAAALESEPAGKTSPKLHGKFLLIAIGIAMDHDSGGDPRNGNP